MCTERELSLLADGGRACRRGRAAAGTRALTGPGPTACRKPGVARLSGNRPMAAPSEPVVTNDSIGSADIDKRYSGHGCGSSRAFARGTSPPPPPTLFAICRAERAVENPTPLLRGYLREERAMQLPSSSLAAQVVLMGRPHSCLQLH